MSSSPKKFGAVLSNTLANMPIIDQMNHQLARRQIHTIVVKTVNYTWAPPLKKKKKKKSKKKSILTNLR